MIADELNELKKSGKLKKFVACGIIPVEVNMYFEIYNYYLSDMKKCKPCKVTQSVTNTADAFKVSEFTVYKSLRIMKQE